MDPSSPSDASVWEQLEYWMHNITVRKIWWLTSSKADVPHVRRKLTLQDYTVARCLSPTFVSGTANTLVTDWASYADAQDAFRCILPSLDIVVLHDLSELDVAAWKRWAYLSGEAGYGMSSEAVIVT